MAGIIAVLLAVSLEVLVTLDVIKAVFVIIVHLVMVVHDFCVCCKKGRHAVIVQAFHVLMEMGGIISDRFVPVKSETRTGGTDHDYRIIPVKQGSCDHKQAQLLTELDKRLACTVLEF